MFMLLRNKTNSLFFYPFLLICWELLLPKKSRYDCNLSWHCHYSDRNCTRSSDPSSSSTSCAIPGTCITPDFVGPLASAISKRLESIGHGASVSVVVVFGVGVLTSQKANWPREHIVSWAELTWIGDESAACDPRHPWASAAAAAASAPALHSTPPPLGHSTPLTLAHIRMQKAKK